MVERMDDNLFTFENNNLIAYLASQGSVPTPVEPGRRLLSSLPHDYPLAEFFDDHLQVRIIAASSESPDIATHDVLRQEGLPVFEEMGESPAGVRLWLVPPGTRPLDSVLPAVGQNMERYGTVLSELAHISTQLHQKGLGLPIATEGRRILDQFAFVQEPESESGASIFLMPPYSLTTSGTPDAFAASALEELIQTNLFDDSQLQQMYDMITLGITR